ncbi:MAG: hypothetical protein HQL08_15055 [Nitrospirae bacterium]|nr:hypothetical protein [Nitrospirota bacterium]
MISSISGFYQTQPTPQSTQTNTNTTKSNSQTSINDTVTISSIAKAALDEATESHAESVKEAMNGDRQAQRLLAKEAAAQQVEK